MKLFDIKVDHNKNLLSKGGTVNYYGKIFMDNEAEDYLDKLLNNI